MFQILLQVLVIVAIVSAKVITPTRLLNDGNKIPALSFGTFGRVRDVDEQVKPAVIQAIESGYRQIDTAEAYQNEVQIGEAIADVTRRGIVTREELYITTKLKRDVGTRDGVLPAIREALKRLQLDYVDLFLIHNPYNWANDPDYDNNSIWKGMEDAKKLNLTRSIGVSNFEINHLNDILSNAEIVPAVNQFEVHPSLTNSELVEYCQRLNIMVLSYAPFGWMVPRPFIYNPTIITFDEPLLVKIARKYGKTTNQVAIRYLIDRGTIPIPKSTNMEHIRSNAQVFDFSLSEDEVASINKLNEDARVYDVFCLSVVRAVDHYYGLSTYLKKESFKEIQFI